LISILARSLLCGRQGTGALKAGGWRGTWVSFSNNPFDHAIFHALNLSVAPYDLQDKTQILNMPYRDLLNPVHLFRFSSLFLTLHSKRQL